MLLQSLVVCVTCSVVNKYLWLDITNRTCPVGSKECCSVEWTTEPNQTLLMPLRCCQSTTSVRVTMMKYLTCKFLSTQCLEGIRRKGVSLINEDVDKICLDWCLVKLRKIALNVGSFNKFDSVTWSFFQMLVTVFEFTWGSAFPAHGHVFCQ